MFTVGRLHAEIRENVFVSFFSVKSHPNGYKENEEVQNLCLVLFRFTRRAVTLYLVKLLRLKVLNMLRVQIYSSIYFQEVKFVPVRVVVLI